MSDSPDDAEPASQEVIEAPEPGDRRARIEERHFEATFTSPLPPPQFLDAYEATLPGAADRILALTESEAEHRQQMVARLVDADAHRTRRGLLYVFVLASIIVVTVTSFAIVAVIVGSPSDRCTCGHPRDLWRCVVVLVCDGQEPEGGRH